MLAEGCGSVRRRSRGLAYALALLAGLSLAGCSSTRLVTKWHDPQIERLAFTKVVALALAPQESMRRNAENALCREIRSVPCTAAYRAVPEGQMQDIPAMKAEVQRAGFDGAVVFRVVAMDEQVTYVPPTYGPTFWGFYAYAYPRNYAPGYSRTDTLVRVETSIYSLRQDRLLWVATTDTVNPESVAGLVEDIAHTVRGELVDEHLIPDQ